MGGVQSRVLSMRWNTFALALAALGALAGSAHAAPRAVVASGAAAPCVELFTSPFCSSCPPADELFVKLAQQPGLITLVMPVDSWDRPGRKDALAKPAFTERQSAYADVRNEDTLYTPQAMINGAAEADGLRPGRDPRRHRADRRRAVGPRQGGRGRHRDRGLRRRQQARRRRWRDDHHAAVHRLARNPHARRRDPQICQPRARYHSGRALERQGGEANGCSCRTRRSTTASSCCCRRAPPEKPGAILGATRVPLRGTLSDLHRTGFGVE